MKKLLPLLLCLALILPLCACGSSRSAEAASHAKDLLMAEPYSRTGLIDKLKQDGFSNMDAVTAVDSLGVDWQHEAERYVLKLLRNNLFISGEETEAALRLAGFGPSEIAYAIG